MMLSGNGCKEPQTEGGGSHVPSASEKLKVRFQMLPGEKLLKNQHIFSKETKKNLHTATLTQAVSFEGLFPSEKQAHMNLVRRAFLAKQGSSKKNVILRFSG